MIVYCQKTSAKFLLHEVRQSCVSSEVVFKFCDDHNHFEENEDITYSLSYFSIDHLIILTFDTSLGVTVCYNAQDDCLAPLGLTSGKVKDEQLSASSSFDVDSTGPQHARARTYTGSGAWCPLYQINNTHKEWIQITFNQDTDIEWTEQGMDEGGHCDLEF
ncbi:hypothetical protein DICVIV_06894 [Dictyocaulus viviparus]|uniref:F5/8 type C domain-containing protein n=1 Tax=Dictyocaulus viviparus TaxID=29172 RepID=A0A0D8XT94_DICVI|nr:hypothetical protein DICVIV_06894 [Dictyocaulus viviparus]